ncbi:hypothetical protein H7F51_01530 [Novosphingobium flavum]|uniref:Uncharacterized protein n=1 Tax=Novosphingobium flavum TaxID=1778672 RepID=A0A7X1FPU6_9SPHN|nr:hypothetical protein [Novosphingobium flavum]MBC2664192.1 hypothetical protein [Novosphingobium flavum]
MRKTAPPGVTSFPQDSRHMAAAGDVKATAPHGGVAVYAVGRGACLDASVNNLFAQERHLVSREVYKQRRSAALAEWQSLMS